MTVNFDVKPNLRLDQDQKASGGVQLTHDLGNDITLKVRQGGTGKIRGVREI